MSMMRRPSLSASTPGLDRFGIWEGFTKSIQAAFFADEIREQREKKGWSVEKAAQRAGMTVEAWKAVENGHLPQTWKEVCALAEGIDEERMLMASRMLDTIRYVGPEARLRTLCRRRRPRRCGE
ncbi:MAG TPA: helix-turn-helix transcriptional regulator [Terracidiphilus sp.]|nr:helix-turn-helix transcriptional regulator [Terracidiphilus sp.]